MAYTSDRAAQSEIIATWEPNKANIEDLREKVSGPRAIPFAPFVGGAGLTAEMGFPGWTASLPKVAGECGKADQVEALLAALQYEAEAETIEAAMSAAGSAGGLVMYSASFVPVPIPRRWGAVRFRAC